MVRKNKPQTGAVNVELVVAMAIVSLAMMPLAYSFGHEHKVQKRAYQRAVAMELVDGEMEILQAGEWRAFKEGTQPYEFHAKAATNLPPGQLNLTIKGTHLRLDWKPGTNSAGGEVHREAEAK